MVMSAHSASPVFFSRFTAEFSAEPALATENGTLTYAQYAALIHATAQNLAAAGLQRGDRLALYLPNCAELAILLMAALEGGIISVPLSTRLPAGHIPNAMQQTGCTALVTAEKPRERELAGLSLLPARELVPATPSPAGHRPLREPHFEQESNCIFTSGSSGRARAVLHTFGNHYFSALGSQHNIPVQPGDRWLLSLPLYHVGGLAILYRTALHGGCVVIPPPQMQLADFLQQEKCTHVSLVATQLRRMLQKPELVPVLQRLKAILLGGSAIPEPLLSEAHGLGLRVHVSYGSSEMSSQITTTRPGADVSELLTAGFVLPHRELIIATDGEILVRGKTRFKGYLEHDDLLTPFDAQGWFATGDIGRLRGDGALQVFGRKDNMFISGGENIHPEEIEMELLQHPGVVQAVVVAVPHAEFGMRPVAFCEITTTEETSFDALRTWLGDRLPRFKIPDRFFPLPGQHGGGLKPDRRQLQELAAEKIRSNSKD